MSDCRNLGGRWPPVELMKRAVLVEDTGKIPFVDTEAAARYLALSPHSPWSATARSAAVRPSTSSASSSATPFQTWSPGPRSVGTSRLRATTPVCTDERLVYHTKCDTRKV